MSGNNKEPSKRAKGSKPTEATQETKSPPSQLDLTKLTQVELLEVLRKAMAGGQTATESPNDVRLVWDVQLIDGAGNAVAVSKGSSDLPGVLEKSQRASAIDLVEGDLQAKVVNPLLSRMQELLSRKTLEESPVDIGVQDTSIRLIPPALDGVHIG